MKIVGLTGGIGSGKTTVAQWFVEKGIPVYDSDFHAKQLTLENKEVMFKIKSLLGEESYVDGEYNRKHVSTQVFENPELLQKLNDIIHPAVFNHFHQWIANQTSDFVVKEAAILFESGSFLDCDFIISVISSEEIRMKRVLKRDSLSEKQIKDRMNNQWTDEQRIERSDLIIENNSDLENLRQEFEAVYNILLKRFQSR